MESSDSLDPRALNFDDVDDDATAGVEPGWLLKYIVPLF